MSVRSPWPGARENPAGTMVAMWVEMAAGRTPMGAAASAIAAAATATAARATLVATGEEETEGEETGAAATERCGLTLPGSTPINTLLVSTTVLEN